MKRARSRSLEQIEVDIERCRKRLRKLEREQEKAPVEPEIARILSPRGRTKYKQLTPGQRAVMREIAPELHASGLLTKRTSRFWIGNWGTVYSIRFRAGATKLILLRDQFGIVVLETEGGSFIGEADTLTELLDSDRIKKFLSDPSVVSQ